MERITFSFALACLIAGCAKSPVLDYPSRAASNSPPATQPAIPAAQPVITGRVLDAAGRPVVDAAVMADTWALGGYLNEAMSQVLATHTDAQGRYSLRLPFGGLLYSIDGEKDGVDADGAQLVVYQDQQIDLHLESRPMSAKIVGHLRTAAGQPAGGVLLTLVDQYDETYHATSDASGAFAFTGLPDVFLGGPATILAETPGDAVPLALIPPSPRSMDFTLTASAKFHGGVDDAIDGKPLAGVSVTITPAEFAREYVTSLRFTTNTDAKGDWHFDHIPPGSYFVDLESADHFSHAPVDDPEVRIGPGENVMRNFRMDRDAHIRGTVIDRAGNPVPGAMACAPVMWNGDNGTRYRWAVSDAQGHFDLATGHVHEELALAVGHGRFGDVHGAMIQPLEPGGSSPDVRIVLPGTVHVTGTVVGPRGEPIADVWCSDALVVGAHSDQHGQFDLGWLSAPAPPGVLMEAEPPTIAPSPFVAAVGGQTQLSPAEAEHRAFYQSASQYFTAAPGESVSVAIRLKEDEVLAIHGQIVDLAGNPIANASMFLFAGTPRDSWIQAASGEVDSNLGPKDAVIECITDAHGNFSLLALRGAGEDAGKQGVRFAIGIATDDEPRKLITDVIVAPDKHRLELKIAVDPKAELKRRGE